MPNSTEPEVVFCEFNHIYDKSLNDTCPYCKQIAEKTNQMKRQISGTPQKPSGRFWNFLRTGRNNDSDATVLRRNIRDDDDDATVLVSSTHDADDDDATELHTVALSGDMDDEKMEYRNDNAADEKLTELRADQSESETVVAETVAVHVEAVDNHQDNMLPIVIYEESVQQTESTATEEPKTLDKTEEPEEIEEKAEQTQPEEPEKAAYAEPRRKVIGWLVCACGEQNYGTSVELREGNNGVVFDHDGYVRIEDEGSVVIYRDRMTGIFQIRAEDDSVATVNERMINGSTYLEPYSRIQIGEHGFVFFPAVGVCGFEWRQS